MENPDFNFVIISIKNIFIIQMNLDSDHAFLLFTFLDAELNKKIKTNLVFICKRVHLHLYTKLS